MAGASQSALAQPLADIDGATVEFPVVFAQAPSTVIFSTAAAGDRGAGPG